MVVLSILLAVAATTAAFVLAVRVRRQGRALGAAADRAAALETELDRTRTDRAMQAVRADTAEAERNEAAASLRAASSELQVAVGSLNEATRARDAVLVELDAQRTELDELRTELDELRASHASCTDTTALWALELARIERRWHLSVAPGIGLTSPLTVCEPDDRLQTAVAILADALREETGTRFQIAWQVERPLPAVTALLVVRAADELLSAHALTAERIRLAVTAQAGTVTLVVTAYDADDATLEPAALATEAFPDATMPSLVVSAGQVVVPITPTTADAEVDAAV